MVAIDDGLVKCKLQRNNAKRPRHFWRGKEECCDCGCNTRIYLKNQPICFEKLREMLNDLGYSIEKINEGVGIEKE